MIFYIFKDFGKNVCAHSLKNYCSPRLLLFQIHVDFIQMRHDYFVFEGVDAFSEVSFGDMKCHIFEESINP